MGIIPWLLLLRLRQRQAQEEGAGGSKEQEKLMRGRLEFADQIRKQSEAATRPFSTLRTQSVEDIFGR